MKIDRTGCFLTKDGRIATIKRIDNGKAHGSIPGHYDTTWWYINSGEHAMCPIDDLVSYAPAESPLPVT